MLRFVKFHSLLLRRKHPRSAKTILSRLLHSDLVYWNQTTACRGVAIGMFWAFIPIPFQMLPATLFCWMIRGNLPVALLCCWITNPITIPLVLLLEYRLGEFLLSLMNLLPVTEAVTEHSNPYSVFTGGLQQILAGGLFLSCVAMLGGYLTIWLSFELKKKVTAQRQRTHRALRKQSTNNN